jgi:D-proline reductase (dithiol) PrdB
MLEQWKSMAKFSDLKLSYRLFMESYSYRHIVWSPGALLEKPLPEATIAVVTSGAVYLPEQDPFDEDIRGGDVSFREIPADADVTRLRVGHRSDAFDHRGLEENKNIALPLDRLREMKQAGEIGDLASVHYSFMGSITSPGRLIHDSAPAMAEKIVAADVDAVLLTPV